MNNIKVTFTAPKYAKKEFKKAPWLRKPEGEYTIIEFFKSESEISLRASAMLWNISKIERN